MNAASEKRSKQDRVIVLSLLVVAEVVAAVGLIVEYAKGDWFIPSLFILALALAFVTYALAVEVYEAFTHEE